VGINTWIIIAALEGVEGGLLLQYWQFGAARFPETSRLGDLFLEAREDRPKNIF
jgi:hypothetical protein